jgi:hypothetical protein
MGADYWYTQQGAWIIPPDACASVLSGRTIPVVGLPKKKFMKMNLNLPEFIADCPTGPLLYKQAGDLAIGGFQTEPGFVCGRNSGSAAMNLALHLGAKRLAVLGFDCSKARDIWMPNRPPDTPTADEINSHSWRIWQTALTVRQVHDHWQAEIRNGSPGSYCTTWERLTPEGAVKWTLNC